MKIKLILIMFLLLTGGIVHSQDGFNIEKRSSLYTFWEFSPKPCLTDEYLYLPTGYSGITTIDISDPEQPTFHSNYRDEFRYYNILAMYESFLYVDIGFPVLGFSLNDGVIEDRIHVLNGYRLSKTNYFFSDNYIFLLLFEWIEHERWWELTSDLIGYSRSNEGQLTYICRLRWNDYVRCRKIYAYGNQLWFDNERVLEIYDMEQLPQFPVIGRIHDLPAYYDFSISENKFTVLFGDYTLTTYEISDIDSLTEIGSIELEGGEGVAVMSRIDDVITVHFENGLYSRINVSNPEEPELMYNFEFGIPHRHRSIHNDLAAIPDDELRVHLFDLSDPEHPEEISVIDGGGQALDVEIVGETAYVAAERQGVIAIDVSDTDNPTEIGRFSGDWFATKITIEDDVCYVITADSIVVLLDISDPEDIIEVAEIDTRGHVTALNPVDELLYITSVMSTINSRIKS